MHLFLAFSPFFLPLLGQNWAHSNENELTLKITPSLMADENDGHVYYVQVYCMNRGKRFPPTDGTFATERSAAANEDKVTISFEQKEPCEYYDAAILLMQSGSLDGKGWKQNYDDTSHRTVMFGRLYGKGWKENYEIEHLENNGMNHRILFGNYFHLTIGPTLTTENLFYQIRVFCDAKETPTKRTETDGTLDFPERPGQYNEDHFKTFTKSSAMVVFGSELRLCNTYHIKVWATPIEWKLEYPDERPMVHFVCSSYGNGEKHEIVFMRNFHLQIEPALGEGEEENVYYAEVECNGNKHQTFRTFTKSKTDVVLHVSDCKSYDFSVRKVPKALLKPQDNMREQIELLHSYEFYSKRKESVANGQTYVFSLANQQPKQKRTSEMTLDGESQAAHQQKGFSQKRLSSYVDLSDSEESDEERKARRKSELKDECYFYNI
ncbi:hypothetical protein niasHT_037022 [Heterodera trifolii]|uniref:Uncharacterized protein n=1 Tax=Heterodera trifolii TaxID=157864 RepID=A0ABD2IQ18_9BILA